MGRASKRKQRRHQHQQPTSTHAADIGNEWLKVHGDAPIHIGILPTLNYENRWLPDELLARVRIPSVQIGQAEQICFLTPCDSLYEAQGPINKVIQSGFATQGKPLLSRRFYCHESRSWVVPVLVNLRLFYE